MSFTTSDEWRDPSNRLFPSSFSEDDRVAEPLVHALWKDFLDDSLEAEVSTAIVGTRWI